MMDDEELIQRLRGKGPKPPMFDTCQEAAERLDSLLEELIVCHIELYRQDKKIRSLKKKLGVENEYITGRKTIDL